MNLNIPLKFPFGDINPDQPPVAIYVHGLASGANGTTYHQLAKRFEQFRWITTDFGADVAENVAQLNELISANHPQLIIGTSMGGLTVLYADAPEAVKVVCNPALSIADCVRNTIGLGKHPYFCERLNGATEFELTEQMAVGMRIISPRTHLCSGVPTTPSSPPTMNCSVMSQQPKRRGFWMGVVTALSSTPRDTTECNLPPCA